MNRGDLARVRASGRTVTPRGALWFVMSSPPILEFLRRAEGLKHTLRNAWTSTGRQESTAEHTWRLCLLAMLVQPEFPEADLAHLLCICLIHDLGEVVRGDVPAPDQAQLPAGKAVAERRDLLTVLAPLPAGERDAITALWDEYEAAATPAGKLAKALDKLETILQHTQGDNPADFDYGFNLQYGRDYTAGHPLLAALRAELDAATEERRVRQGVSGKSLAGLPRARRAARSHTASSVSPRCTTILNNDSPRRDGWTPFREVHHGAAEDAERDSQFLCVLRVSAVDYPP